MRILIIVLAVINVGVFIIFFPDIMNSWQSPAMQDQLSQTILAKFNSNDTPLQNTAAQQSTAVTTALSDAVSPTSALKQNTAANKQNVNNASVASDANAATVPVVTEIQAMCIQIQRFKTKKAAESVKVWLKARGVVSLLKTNVLLVDQMYRVYIGNTVSKSNAKRLQDWVADKSVDGFVYRSGTGTWRVSVGSFSSEELAKKQAEQLKPRLENTAIKIEQLAQTKSYFTLRIEGVSLSRYDSIDAIIRQQQLSKYKVSTLICGQ